MKRIRVAHFGIAHDHSEFTLECALKYPDIFEVVGICEPDVWGKGIGTNTLRAFINYYFENGLDEIYTQTWSGNIRMLRCAKKLGFVECDREIGEREVDGQKYDGLTFKIGK